MSEATKGRWKGKQSEETRGVEEALRKVFRQADAYRYNSASIRVRVVDPRFEGKSEAERDAMVERVLHTLPEQTQADIINLFTFSPGEIESPDVSFRKYSLNAEFENPSKSDL